jgi:hypothetical protein
MLEFMETKECHDFPGGCLGGNEIIMAESGAHAPVLESFGTSCDGTWLWQCHFTAGKGANDAENDRGSKPDAVLKVQI